MATAISTTTTTPARASTATRTAQTEATEMTDICDRFQSEPFALPRHTPEPFYTEALPCESCGRPAEERYRDEDSGLLIGVDCVCITIPDEPICSALEGPIMAAKNVREIVEACKAHREYCPICKPVQGKEIEMEHGSEAEPERKAA